MRVTRWGNASIHRKFLEIEITPEFTSNHFRLAIALGSPDL